MSVEELRPAELHTACDPEQFDFQTTEHLEPLEEILGQPRAVEAVRFGIDIQQEGYNIFALGPPGTGKRSVVMLYLQQRTARDHAPDDWCYVNNFQESHKPCALSVPAGRGPQLRRDMEHLLEDVRAALTATFESEEYRRRHQELEARVSQGHREGLEQVQQKAREKGLAVMPTPAGLALVPLGENGRPMPPDEARQLPAERREQLEQAGEELQEEMRTLMEQAPRAQREGRRQERELNEQTADAAVEPLIAELRRKYEGLPKVGAYLDAVKADLVESAEKIMTLLQKEQQAQESSSDEGPQPGMAGLPVPAGVLAANMMRRYAVNVLVSHDPHNGAPLVYEDHPTYPNVIGRTEHLAQMGTLLADFTLIKPGALHRANGGYLVLEAHKLLMQPMVWEGLKRALRARQIRIESLGQAAGFIQTVSLEPEPIPLDVKVVLLGTPMLYGMLRELDSDFAELFKVPADFDTQMDRDGENQALYARLIATLAQREQLKPFDRSAVARVIERSARMTGDSKRLSVHMRRVADLLHEAHYWARHEDHDTVTAADVDRAVEAQIYRCNRMHERLQEEIQRETLRVETTGERVGQLNGLAVFEFGDFYFGRPSRITARVRMGSGQVVDIEREVQLGGPTHSKGVLILSGFLTGRYARKLPLSLTASLVFEQSYGPIGGDSASSAELYALLSAIGEVPLRQSLAVTGSVDQHGRVQAIGGVNEKIEGFFEVCRTRGLTGEQGVLIPRANVQHLMLRADVVEAVGKGQFHIWAVETIDEGIEILTGLPAGEPDEKGHYPPDSVNGKVAAALAEYARQRRKFGPMMGKGPDGATGDKGKGPDEG